jgi:hypothetical protein
MMKLLVLALALVVGLAVACLTSLLPETLVGAVVVALVGVLMGIDLAAPEPDCWVSTAPFGTCGVTLGLVCEPLA